jgi:D-alanine-D-alanine ligase-like ATP-grasp enzyme
VKCCAQMKMIIITPSCDIVLVSKPTRSQWQYAWSCMQVLLIEVNTVPGMTPSTVLIHQVS